MSKTISLTRYLVEKQRVDGHIPAHLRLLIEVVARACKRISLAINKGAVGGVLGSAGSENVQGEVQKKLDIIANEVLIEANEWGGHLAAMASEEMESIHVVPNRYPQGEYLLLFDPLDGSSNIEVNVSIGTIFSVLHMPEESRSVQEKDFLQSGSRQVAAGYVVYGSSTMLVYTTGNGVNGFTLDPSLGSYYLSNPNMRFPEDGKIYSINEGNYIKFPQGVKDYIKYCQREEENRPYTSRYIGSLVADFHRNMIKGGIYIYPSTSQSPRGKLRLLYECNPMAFLTEQAGGKASDGFRRILDIEPTELHQRTPFFCGSRKMVEKVEEFMRNAPE